VLVLEARDRVGGRTLTKTLGDGKFWVDLGGSYVGPTQDCVLNLIDELKLETYLVDDTKDIGYLKSSFKLRQGNQVSWVERRARFKPDKDPPFGNIFHWIDYVHLVKLIDAYGAQIPSESPWLAPKAEEWDSKSFKQFVDESAWTRRVRDYFNHIFVTIDICCDANEVSMLWFLWYVKQCGGYGRAISTTNGGQERKILNGSQQLSERLSQLLGEGAVLLNKPVFKLDQTDKAFALVTTTDGSKFKAKYVICAISPHLLLKIHHEPALPREKNLLAQRSPMGQVAKVILYYKRAFWKEHGFSGCFLIDSYSRGRSLDPVILSLDETKPDGSHPAIIGFVGARGWFEMRNLPESEVGCRVAESYARVTGLREFLNFERVERADWTGEQYSGGCYTSTHPVNTLFKYGASLREPFGRIHYAGTETATKWSGYMDGAISAGKRAARELLYLEQRLTNADDVWREEPASKSVPPRPFEYPVWHEYAPSWKCLLGLAHSLLAAGLLTFVVYRRLAIR